jgi:hypothetical protein
MTGMAPPSRGRVAACALALALVACGTGGGGGDELGDQRAEDARAAAESAGLPADVAAFLGQLGGAVTATYQVTYPATDGTGSVVISQDPPNRRVDLTDGRDLVESHITRDGTSYRCVPIEKKGALTCERTGSGDDIGGAFTPEALASTSRQLRASASDYDLAIERRTIAKAKVTCLVATRKPERPAADAGIDGTICVSVEGVVLAVIRGDEEIEATGYSLEVPDGTFELPDRAG